MPFFSESILADNVTTEVFIETVKVFPAIGHSSFQNDVTASQTQLGSVPIDISLAAAPQKFHEAEVSGLAINNEHN